MTEDTETRGGTGTRPLSERPARPRAAALRRFLLVRDEDETGVSGTGVVAEGVEFATGACALSWLTRFTSVAVYPDIDELVAIHGHDGRTTVQWCLDEAPADAVPRILWPEYPDEGT